ncbi:hypothetical protein [Actinomadura algeriensis]|uniref:Plasmid stabilization system protein ParE n=1 Tax=Actinomadura algeriensis TaxID=1679523 RepID=A0ABR9JMR0_9ACTN|nr:hypothetical protein [Actinomadura algeriensis]MBE1531849.1 plasmid stabilization system protein ParE [Actinomadura algeriensis]
MTRDRIRDLIPSASVRREAVDDLARRAAAIPADDLVDAVLDAAEPWWRRMGCARALTGRVPDERAAALLALVRDGGAGGEARSAVLAALSEPARPHSDDLLGWLRAQEGREGEVWYGAVAAIPAARGRLGDLSAARSLAALAANPWWHLRRAGEEAVDGLIDRCGLPAVLAELGVDSPAALAARGASAEERLLGLTLQWRAGGDIVASLADGSRMVARTAHDLLADSGEGDGALWEMARRRAPGRLWALAVLHRRGHDVRSAWEEAGSPRVEVPGLPPDVRAAIVRRFAPGERDTDPRWLVEAALLAPEPEPDGRAAAELDRAVRALADAGLEPGEPQEAGRHHGSGHGTYHVVEIDSGRVLVSKLGPYVTSLRDDVRPIMRAAGFTNVHGDLAETVVDGLHVYFFGERDPLRVHDLLFYWQD